MTKKSSQCRCDVVTIVKNSQKKTARAHKDATAPHNLDLLRNITIPIGSFSLKQSHRLYKLVQTNNIQKVKYTAESSRRLREIITDYINAIQPSTC